MGLRVRIQPTAGASAALAASAVELPAGQLRAGVKRALRHAALREAEISLALLDDAEIAALNRQYLAHEGATDVISFALFEPPEPPLGDVYIGTPQALRQARARRIDPGVELVRLAIHGTLHVLGYEHDEGEDRVRGEMWQLQEALVREVLS